MNRMSPGGGGRFAKFVHKVEGEGKSPEAAKAIAAAAGRKKYGAKRFAKMASAGRARHAN